MTATIDEGKVQALGSMLKAGMHELDGVLGGLRGGAVSEIHVALQGTDTAQAFDEKVTELVHQLQLALPAFEALATFIDRFVENFQASDRAQAAALRG